MKKRLFFCLLLLTLGMLSALAQTPTTQGTEFWASFMRNGYNTTTGTYNHFTLIASAKHACTVTVSNPNTGWSEQFSVQNNGVSTFYVNRNQGYNDQMGGKAFKGLYITSTDTISLYIANEAENSYDAANVLPASTLGSQYMIQSYKAMGDQSSHYGDSRASFLVLATEDNTTVQITPSCVTNDNHPAGQPYTVTLSRGECYHVLNKNAGSTTNEDGDFSGTTVVSIDGKPIAVFNGNSITSVPGGLSTGYDHIFEQAMPTDYWGKKFVVTSTRCPNYMNLQPDQIKVTALYDNTKVRRNGVLLFTLNSGESDYFEMNLVTDPCTYLEADSPIAVFLYQHSHGDGSPAYGDPSMVWISPVEQKVYEVTFSTFEVQEVEVHYVNVVCYSENVADMTLDGQNIAASFEQVPDFPELSYTRMQLNHAAHTLRCPGGFIAHVYGIGQAEGYAYSVGSSAKLLTKQLYVDGILSTEYPDGYTTCQDEQVLFRVETNYEIDHVVWDFGDNTPGWGIDVSHAYAAPGDYEMMSVIYRRVDFQVQPFDTLTLAIHVNPSKATEMDPMTTCGTTYLFNNEEYSVPGDYYVHMETSLGCDSIVHIHLLQGTQTTCTLPRVYACEQYEWFDSIYTETNHHLEHLVPNATPDGCDSLYILDLVISYPPEDTDTTIRSCEPMMVGNAVFYHTCDTSWIASSFGGCEYELNVHFILLPSEETYDTIVDCDSYLWHDDVILTVSGDYCDTIYGTNGGCDSYLHLHLELNQSPPFNEIRGLGNVAVATNFWPGEYTYFINDSTGVDPATLIWELSDNENGEWGFKPHGASCNIVTYTMGNKVLSVKSLGPGICDMAPVTKTIYCTGYSVGEDSLVPMEIYPNPATDELFVKCEDIQEVLIYNLLGQIVAERSVHDESEVRLNVGNLPSAFYLVEIRTAKGNKTQLVSVRR